MGHSEYNSWMLQVGSTEVHVLVLLCIRVSLFAFSNLANHLATHSIFPAVS